MEWILHRLEFQFPIWLKSAPFAYFRLKEMLFHGP